MRHGASYTVGYRRVHACPTQHYSLFGQGSLSWAEWHTDRGLSILFSSLGGLVPQLLDSCWGRHIVEWWGTFVVYWSDHPGYCHLGIHFYLWLSTCTQTIVGWMIPVSLLSRVASLMAFTLVLHHSLLGSHGTGLCMTLYSLIPCL